MILDTETNAREVDGKFTYKQHIIELSYYIVTKKFEIIKKVSTLIKGVASEMYENQPTYTIGEINRHGKPWEGVFNELLSDIETLDERAKIISHNLRFDKAVIMYSSECMDIDKELISKFSKHVYDKGYCSMLNTCSLCKLSPYRYGSYKYPKLTELYAFLFGEEIVQQHRAEDDVKLLLTCIKRICENERRDRRGTKEKNVKNPN